MSQYKVLIVDDEVLSRESIKLLLAGQEDWVVVGEAVNGRDALEQIDRHKPDVVFMDIEMPKMTGMEVLTELKSNPLIVFTTAYDTYAIKAFEQSAIDYLLKPYTDSRFFKTLDRVRESLEEREAIRKLETITQLLHDRSPRTDHLKSKFSVTIADTIHIVEEKEILWVQASGNYVEINTAEKKYIHRDTIAHLTEILHPESFARINRSIIVRIDQVKQLRKHHSGEYFVVLRNGVELKLSRSYKGQASLFLR